ncbi:7314_t:CDS:2 [Funneliformis geosporum]|uniref:3860_t:CDS:1 n=1 Tax=Funneliformis geosporum TaxID=1117311 RepID=A0A9W4SUE4_9GLOM|nr:3860_t:CDS:2 [Funneliformis geosporum]CAI2181339.1 7314_t:CDS:2 [Funneliformis geosporum]
MSSVTIGKVLGWISFITLLHSTYSTYEHLSYLKAVEKVANNMPIEYSISSGSFKTYINEKRNGEKVNRIFTI